MFLFHDHLLEYSIFIIRVRNYFSQLTVGKVQVNMDKENTSTHQSCLKPKGSNRMSFFPRDIIHTSYYHEVCSIIDPCIIQLVRLLEIKNQRYFVRQMVTCFPDCTNIYTCDISISSQNI